MSEGSDAKRKLGRVRLQRQTLAVEERDALDAAQPRPDERARSADSVRLDADARSAAQQRPTLRTPPSSAREGDGAIATAPAPSGVFGEHQGMLSVDLRQIAIPLKVLALVPREVARDKLVLPIAAEGEHLFLAVADPTERQVADELEFTTGRRVIMYLALHGMLRDVIESAYAAEAAGASIYRGPLASGVEPSVATRELAPDGSDGPYDARLTGAGPGPSGEGLAFDDELSRPLTALPPREVLQLDGLEDDLALDPAPPTPKRKQRLLIVDDSEDIRRLLVRALRERDYETIESASGLDALSRIRECAPDLLLLDAMLPEVHGFDLCRRIKSSRRYGHIPIVMVSAVYRGWRFAEDLRRSYGVEEFLEKPFRIGEVVAAVERALQGTSRAQAGDEPELVGPAAAHLQAGIDAYAQGSLDAAIEHIKKGIGVDPLAFRLHYHLGLLYGKQENVFEAIQALETAADLRPRDFSTLKNLAVLYQRAGFRLKATEMWERALGTAPDDDTRAGIRNHLVSLL